MKNSGEAWDAKHAKKLDFSRKNSIFRAPEKVTENELSSLLSEGAEVQILLSTVGIGMISRNCEIIPICLCNGKKSLRFTLGIANEIGIRIMKISQQKSTYFQNRKMNSS